MDRQSYLEEQKAAAAERRKSLPTCAMPECVGTARQNRKLCQQHYERMRRFKLTEDELIELLTRGQCDICGKPDKGVGTHVIDHDHVTGLARGYLCRSCNNGIERVTDPNWRILAQEYFSRHFISHEWLHA
jgi:hypothetical protein